MAGSRTSCKDKGKSTAVVFHYIIEKMQLSDNPAPGNGQPTINDLYQASNHNLPWEGFKYVVPARHQQADPAPPQPTKASPKLNYIDYLLRTKKTIPAPNAYNNMPVNRPVSGKMDRHPRTTTTDEAIAKNKKQQIPGPGHYLVRPKTADVKVNRNVPEHRPHYLNEVEYLSAENPGIGEYNLLNDQRQHITSPKFGKVLRKSTSARVKTEKSTKEKTTPTLVMGTFDWLSAQKRPCNKNFFGKGRRFEEPSKSEKKPGPNSYKMNVKWTDPTQIMKTACSLSNFKSVYYG